MSAPNNSTVPQPPERPAPTSSSVTPPKPATLRERIENNLVVFFLGALLTGFLAGIGTYGGALRIFDFVTVPKSEIESKVSTGLQHRLRIEGVEGFDGNSARIIAQVNGRSYSYPTQTVWVRLRPNITAEEFMLPDASLYSVSFRMLTSDGQEFGSQEVFDIKQWPFDGKYELSNFVRGNAGDLTCTGPTPQGIENKQAFCVSPETTQGVVRVQYGIR